MTNQPSNYAAEVECAIGLNAGGGAEGVYAARDAVLALRDRETEQLRDALGAVTGQCRAAEARVAELEQQLADADAEIAELAEHNDRTCEAVTRAEQAEAAIARVLVVLVDPLLHTADPERQGERYLARQIRAALDEPQQPTTNPAAAVEVRQPCPYCGDHQMIPRRQYAEHVARLHPEQPQPTT